MATIAFVSVARKYEEGMTVAELEEISYGFWASSLKKVEDVDAVIPVFQGEALIGFTNRGSYQVKGTTYTKNNGSEAPRIAFSYGEAFPVHNLDLSDLNMRSGIQVKELDIKIPYCRK